MTIGEMSTRPPWESKWTIEGGQLDEGGQGFTHIVRSKFDGSLGVLKVLRDPDDPASRRRIHLRSQRLKVVRGANGRVPAVLDDNTNAGTPYFVMEFIKGELLSKYIAQTGPRSIKESIAITLAICETLRVGHIESVVHRDLKPDNVMLTQPGEGNRSPVVLDYGLSFNSKAEQEKSASMRKSFKTAFTTRRNIDRSGAIGRVRGPISRSPVAFSITA